jgi:hypothetical protein
MKEWTITQLKQAMVDDLSLCHTDLERQMCRVICSKEIRERAEEIKRIRKLTPGEITILEGLQGF